MKKLTFFLILLASIAKGQTVADVKVFIETQFSKELCDEAFTKVKASLEKFPNNDTLHYYQGWLKINCLSDYPSALADFEKTVSQNPKSANGLLGKGMCLSKMGKPLEALEFLMKSQELDVKNPQTYFQMGYACYLMGASDLKNFSKAVSWFDKAIEMHTEDMNFYLFRAISYYYLQDYKKANQDFSYAEEINDDDPSKPDVLYYGGLNDFQLGYYERGSDRLTQYSERDSLKPEVWLYRGLSLLKIGNMAKAMTDLNKYLKLKPNDPDIYFAIAEGYTNSEDKDMGHVYYDKAARFGHKKAQEVMKNYAADFVVHRKTQGIPVTFATDKNWLIDEFNDNPSVSSCNGMVFYSSNVKITFALLENNQLINNPKASCSLWDKELKQDGTVDTYKTTAYSWTRTISDDTWESPGETYGVKVLKLTPNIPGNQIMVYIFGKPEDMDAMDFYISHFLESIRIGQ